MVSDRIENLKQQYTDKYVVVDGTRPELARFRDVVGRVKTVNMSGRVLVEFLDYHTNIGWYDVDPSFLKVVDKPQPKAKEAPAAKPPAKKPAGEVAAATGEKKLSPLAMARAQGAKKAPGGKPSVADILAKARGGAAAKPQAEKPAGEAPAAKSSGGKPSVADILAAARGGKAAEPQAEKPVAERSAPAPESEAAPEPEVAPAAQESTAKIDKSSMSIDDMLAWCRAHDKK